MHHIADLGVVWIILAINKNLKIGALSHGIIKMV